MGDKVQAARYATKYLSMTVEMDGSYEKRVEGNLQYCPARAYTIALSLLMTGDLEQAQNYQQIAMNSYPCHDCHYGKCFEAYYCGGLILEIMGNYRKAAEMYQEALRIEPDYPRCSRALKRVAKYCR